MCGICGIAGDVPRKKREARVAGALKKLAHRGPDGNGFVSCGDATLGHTRLAIIDLSPEAGQPMPNERGDILFVFNGEIYNYRDLARDLGGHTFRSRMDGEIILHLYEEKGEAVVNSLLGMFAFALWDSRVNRLLLARDRFGQKPLYYFVSHDTIYFASEIKALLFLMGEVPDLSLSALHEFFYFQYIHGPRTVFKGVKHLLPSHTLTWDMQSRHTRIEQYYDPVQRIERAIAPDTAVDTFLDELKRAVGSQLAADVPLGVFLSGGIDSGSVAWAASQSKSEVVTFTAAFRDGSFNEAPLALKTAESLRTERRFFQVQPDIKGNLPTIARSFGNPFADPSILPTWELCRAAREVVKVALSGDGADELLAGYDRFRALKLASIGPLRRLASAANRFVPPARRGVRSTLDRASRLVRTMRYRDLAQVNLHLKMHWTPEADRLLLAPDFLNASDEPAPTDAYFELVSRCRAGDRGFDVASALSVDVLGYLADDILVKTDVLSMAHGLEVRAPYLDHILADYLFCLPLSHRLGMRQGKLLLRRAMTGRLPAETVRGRKLGFGVPLARWLRNELAFTARECLQGSPFLARLIRRDAADRMLKEHVEGRRDWSDPIWALVILALWHEGVESWAREIRQAA